MIHSRAIPFTAEKFIRRCTDDVAQKRYAPGERYLDYLIEVTRPGGRSVSVPERVLRVPNLTRV